MLFKVIASGSSGNSSILSSQNTNILIDCGISAKRIKEALENYDISLDELDAILITHDHVDHVSGLRVLFKKTKAKIYLSLDTYKNLKRSANFKEIFVDDSRFYILDFENDSYKNIYINNINIEPLKTFHDSKGSVGYLIYIENYKMVYITDTGYIPETYLNSLKNADLIFLECNYDIDLLMSSNRPFVLKQRILGDYGHLSNIDSLNIIKEILSINTKKVILGHISEECNRPNIILNELDKIIKNKDELNIEFSLALRNGLEEIRL